MITTRAAIARAPGLLLDLSEITLDDPRDDEVLVRMVACGVCHTDASALSGRLPVDMPIVLGHEGAGIVERVGSRVTLVEPGDHVLFTPDFCGKCRQCRIGATPYCEQSSVLVFGGTRLDGSTKAAEGSTPVRAGFFGQSSFSEYSLVTERNILTVPRSLSLTSLAALTCGFNAGAGAILNSLQPGPEHSVGVFGIGTVGLAAIIAARLRGVRTILAVDRHPARLQLAQELGATDVIRPQEDRSLAEQIHEIAPQGIDRTLDTTGVAAVLRTAVEVLATRGRCGFVAGTGGVPLDLDVNTMLTKGTQLRAIMGGDGTGLVFLQLLVDLYAEGKIPIEKLIKLYPFTDINLALEDMRTGATVKPVLTFIAPTE